jgi:hypothetical protein
MSIVVTKAMSQLCAFHSPFQAILSAIDSMTVSAPRSE